MRNGVQAVHGYGRREGDRGNFKQNRKKITQKTFTLHPSLSARQWWKSTTMSIKLLLFIEMLFLGFCMKLEVHKGSKLTEPDFYRKFSFYPNLRKGP